MRSSTARPIRRYAIHRYACYSLRDAARAADLPPQRLRRAVILGDLPAEPVADDRDYLIRGKDLQDHLRSIRRGERADFSEAESVDWGLGIFLAFPLVAILIGSAALCSAPGADRPELQAVLEATPVRVDEPARKGRPINPGSGPWSWYPDLRSK